MTRRRIILALLAVVILAELFMRDRYEQVIVVHIDVLHGMTLKMQSIAEAGRRPTPNDLTEMLYPLSRARQFVEQYRDESGRQSFRAFVEFVDAYEAMVTAVDGARGAVASWQAFRPRLDEMVLRVDAGAERTRALLAEST